MKVHETTHATRTFSVSTDDGRGFQARWRTGEEAIEVDDVLLWFDRDRASSGQVASLVGTGKFGIRITFTQVAALAELVKLLSGPEEAAE